MVPLDIHRRLGLTILASCLAAAAVAAQADERASADSLTRKIDRIVANGEAESPKALRTRVSEREANAYLALELADELPAGLETARVTMLGDGRLTVNASVDLARLSEGQEGRPTGGGALSFITGVVPLIVTGSIRTMAGQAWLAVEAVSVSGVPVPTALVGTLISRSSRSADLPDGLSLDEPFVLPARIREILITRGEAVVVQ